jgi:hypothetical protein
VIGAARLECGEPQTETGELIRRQLDNGFGDFFDLHVAYAEARMSDGLGAGPRPSLQVALRQRLIALERLRPMGSGSLSLTSRAQTGRHSFGHFGNDNALCHHVVAVDPSEV